MRLEGNKLGKYEFITKFLYVQVIMLNLKLNSDCTIKKIPTQEEHCLCLSELWWNKQLEAKGKGNCTHPERGNPQLWLALPSKKNSPLATAQSYTQLLTVSTCVIGFIPNSRSPWHCALPALPRE